MGEIIFNGPPPPQADAGIRGPVGEFRKALDERPGEWGQIVVKDAGSRAYYLKQRGYEAVSRKGVLYARKPVSRG